MRITDATCDVKMEVGESVRGECGYCGERVEEKEELRLPLECSACHQFFHLRCLKGPRPTELRGDRLWLFTCALCHPHRKETCIRPYLQWVHVIHLVLYHLMVTQDGRDGFFRWNEDICGCIQKNWQTLMPQRKRTQSWHSTVAGTLSVHCPSLFQSGAKQLGESGYWTLTSVSPPDFSHAMRTSSKTLRTPLLLSDPSTEGKTTAGHQAGMEVDPSPSPPSPPHSSPSLLTFSSLHSSLTLISSRQEATLLSHLNGVSTAVGYCPRASRLRRKLKIRRRQRNHGYPTFDLDRRIIHSLSTTVKYVVDKEKPHSEQVVTVTQRGVITPHPSPLNCHSHTYHTVLHHISTFPLLTPSGITHFPRLTTYFSGHGLNFDPIASPYTSRLLKPYIFRSRDIKPPQVKLLGEVVSRYIIKHPDHAPYSAHSVDLCYLQRSHLAACNGILSQFFWRVDVSDSLGHPDFTCVALYGKMVVGCAFMTPDVKVGETYISFLLVHPHFSRAGIGKMMLYHLIQSCWGKDVTLHVSIDNPAMLLYQSFGFKAERYCLDFYDRYYPPSHPHSRHAYFMRLHR